MTSGSEKPRKDGRKRRTGITVRFDSTDEVKHVKAAAAAAGISCNQYCVERITLSKGYRDPIYVLSSRLLGAANIVRQDSFLARDLFQELTKLRNAYSEQARSAEASDVELRTLIATVNDAVGELFANDEQRSKAGAEIAQTARELVTLVTQRDVSDRTSPSAIWGKAKR